MNYFTYILFVAFSTVAFAFDLTNNFINGIAVNGPSIILFGDNVTIHCGIAKFNYLENINWKYRPLNSNAEVPILQSINHTLMTNSTEYSYMTIKNVSNWFNGEYICSATEKIQKNTVKIIYPLMVRKPYRPVLYEVSNTTIINLTESIRLKCKMRGLPQPTISWLYGYQKLQASKNNTRISFEDNNQTLHIRNISYDDLGMYKCTASSKRMGDVSKNIQLTLKTASKKEVEFSTTSTMVILLMWSSLLIIGLGIALYILITLLNCLKKKRKLDAFRKGALHSINCGLSIEEQGNLLPYDETFEFPKDKIKLGILLGSGAFGVVHKAEAIGIIEKNVTSTIAVKMVKPGLDSKYVNALGSELKIMIHLGKHVNIVNLLGACTGNLSADELMVLVEYCRYGNIRDYMMKHRSCFVNQVTADGRLNYNYKTKSFAHNPYYEYDPNTKNSDYENDANKKDTSINIDITAIETGDDGYLLPDEPESRYQYQGDYENEKSKELCTHDLFCWSFQVARGMEYLASQRILHGDLATRNILLADDNIVKICDFGFSKTMYNSENYKKKSDGLLPIKWMAIESIKDNIYSTQSDIWAFGIVLWEIFSLGTTPYPGTPARDVLKKLEAGYRMEQPSYANPDIYNIMFGCWKKEPMTRPSFSDLVEYIGVLFKGDEKAYYTSLNDDYVKKNTKETNSKSILNILKEPTYLNSKNTITTYPELKRIESTEDSDLTMKEL